MRRGMRWGRRDGGQGASGELPMTPMIDVVFLLLVFFLATVRPQDVLAHLDVSRGGFSVGSGAMPVLRIRVDPDRFSMNGRDVLPGDLDRMLGRLGEMDPAQAVWIVSSRDASHERLVQVLDLCAKAGLVNLTVASGR